MLRGSANEALRMKPISDIENGLAFLEELGSLAVMDVCRCHRAQAGMAMSMVIPGEEVLAEAAGILDGTKAGRGSPGGTSWS